MGDQRGDRPDRQPARQSGARVFCVVIKLPANERSQCNIAVFVLLICEPSSL
jgi:hypothetical protein